MPIKSHPHQRCLTFCMLVATLWIQHSLHAFTKSGTSYTTNGSQSDVSAAITAAAAGETVQVPAGTFTWGASGAQLSVNKAITLQGAGTGSTIINISSSAPTWGSGVVAVSGACTVTGFNFKQSGGAATTAISATGSGGWRVTNIVYNSAATAGYFLYGGTYGLIDNCVLNGGAGSDEMIFTRGPTDSWQTASSMGSGNAVYVEDCTFNSQGYTDFNSNARAVVRFCTINPSSNFIKLDAHGLASNSPPRSCRHVEFYNNTWSAYGQVAMEIRGGTGMVFDNTAPQSGGNAPRIFLDDYTLGSQTPSAVYPLPDQIGVGKDPLAAASEPLYAWHNLSSGTNWSVTNEMWGTPMSGLINPDRDYFDTATSFNGSSGVGRGTKAQMLAITPSKKGVGYWVTDEGSWRTGYSGTSGQLYTWTGSAWALKYTPYAYPHPLRTGATVAPSNATTTIQVM